MSKGRTARGKVFRMRALAVREELRCQGLAAEVLGELHWQEELVAPGTKYKYLELVAPGIVVVGAKYKLVVDLAYRMENGGAGPYARQGSWTG